MNIYFSLQGREPNGALTRTEYLALKTQIRGILKNYRDTNSNYTNGAAIF